MMWFSSQLLIKQTTAVRAGPFMNIGCLVGVACIVVGKLLAIKVTLAGGNFTGAHLLMSFLVASIFDCVIMIITVDTDVIPILICVCLTLGDFRKTLGRILVIKIVAIDAEIVAVAVIILATDVGVVALRGDTVILVVAVMTVIKSVLILIG